MGSRAGFDVVAPSTPQKKQGSTVGSIFGRNKYQTVGGKQYGWQILSAARGGVRELATEQHQAIEKIFSASPAGKFGTPKGGDAIEEIQSQLSSASKGIGYLARSKLMSRAKSNSVSDPEGGMKVFQPVGYTKYGRWVSKDAPAQCQQDGSFYDSQKFQYRFNEELEY